MSRIPQSPRSRTPGRSPSKLTAPSAAAPRSKTPTTPTPSPRVRTKSTPSKPTLSRPLQDTEPPIPKLNVSLRDAIAQKRAEAKKALEANRSVKHADISALAGLEDADPIAWNKPTQDDISDLGRWSLRETIERARSSGSINLCSRDLPCLPSALFEIHLGVTPAPLKSVPDEPALPPSDPAPHRKGGKDGPTWFDAQDLEILRAWSNRIVEIHPEISLFGSLKTIDLHNNCLSSLPESFADLTALVSADLSHNSLQSLPGNLFTLPNLVTLNLAHNQLTSLPFQYPFTPENLQRLRKRKTNDFFTPEIYRADAPLPALRSIDVSFNKINASSIDENIPAFINKFDLSSNPLRSGSANLFKALGRLMQLKELRCNQVEIGDDAFPANLLEGHHYPKIQIFDLGETKVTKEALAVSLRSLEKELDFDHSTEQPPEGVVRVIVGKKVVKESWELEAEKWGKRRVRSPASTGSDSHSTPAVTDGKEALKAPWEIDAEHGLLTEGGRRRARAAAATAKEHSSTSLPTATKTPLKETWEIQAEEGLSAGAIRLRRAKAAEAAAQTTESNPVKPPSPSNGANASLANSNYYSASTLTLTLPSSTALSNKGGSHARSFSVVSPAVSQGSLFDLTIPTPTLPLSFIVSQPIAQTLKVLVLTNRRMDQSFSLPPSSDEELLPHLEELSIEGCGLGDLVPTFYAEQPSGARTNEALFPLLAKLFPSLVTLDLTYNLITSKSLTTEALSALILDKNKPLKHLRLRGNRIADLDGFQGLAEHFKGHREMPGWKLEELDLRDNEIGRLPAELGLLPLDVFLVDGNTFRVPQRRIWEREGTKGLLSWLRGRLE